MRIVNTSKHISIQHVSLNLIKLKQKSNFKFAILKLLPFSLEVGAKSPIHYSHDYKGLHPDHHSWNPNSSHSTLDTRLLCIRHFCSILPCSLCPFSELSPSCLHPKLLKVVSIPCLYQYYDNKLKDLNQGRCLTQVVHRFFLPQEFRIRTESVWADLLNKEAMNLEGIRWPRPERQRKLVCRNREVNYIWRKATEKRVYCLGS